MFIKTTLDGLLCVHGLNQKILSQALGCSESTITRLKGFNAGDCSATLAFKIQNLDNIRREMIPINHTAQQHEDFVNYLVKSSGE